MCDIKHEEEKDTNGITLFNFLKAITDYVKLNYYITKKTNIPPELTKKTDLYQITKNQLASQARLNPPNYLFFCINMEFEKLNSSPTNQSNILKIS